MECALNSVNIEFLKKYSLQQSITKLSEPECQLICLAKFINRSPPVLLIEKPHYTIQNLVNDCIMKYFSGTTVIFVGRPYSNFEICDRVYDMDKEMYLE